MDKKDIAIIIVNYINFIITKKCINNLINIGVIADIIIVDNCSPNESLYELENEFKKYKNIYVIQSERNGGYSYGNNVGIKFCESLGDFKFICIMNPDVILESNYLNEICDKISNYDDVAGVSSLMFFNGKFETNRITWRIPYGKEIYKEHFLMRRKKTVNCICKQYASSLVEVDVLPGSFFIFKKDLFYKVGLLDENVFLYNEENILGCKLKELGLKVLIDTSHYYLHMHITPDKNSVFKKYKNNFNEILQDYKYGYQSRKYLCKHYLKGKYYSKLLAVNILNLIILYMKHFIALFHKLED